MHIAQVLAGFSLGQADMLRKAMGKKDPEVMAQQRGQFLAGAGRNGFSADKAAKVFEEMEHFAGYGFNKSHSTPYALLAYQTAYLKANYPWHFAAALLTIEAQNTDKLSMYLGECRDRGIPVLPPDVNESELRFTVTPDGVRFGLTAVKNVGEGAILSILSILDARKARGGPLQSLFELCEEVDLRLVNKRVLESLIKAGACDSMGRRPDGTMTPPPALRPQLLAAVDAACEHGSRRQRDRDLGQAQLFGGADHEGTPAASVPLPQVPAWSETEQLAAEKESLGLYWSGHPIDRFAAELQAFGAKTTVELASTEPTARAETWGPGGRKPIEPDTSIGGIVAGLRQLKTRKGDRMAVFTLEDALGGVEVVVFPDAFAKAAHLIEAGRLVLVRGRLERDDETARILAAEIAPIDAVRERVAREVAIRVAVPPHGRQTFEAVGEVLSRHRGDRKVCLEVELRNQPRPLLVHADVTAQIRVRPSERLVSELEEICGAGSVSLRS
jgi:DNA polymerase III subunit alpha